MDFKKPLVIITSIFVLTTGMLFAQERTISGVVSSQVDDLPLPGVNVLVKGTSIGAVTDFNGAYKLTLENTDVILVFSSIGFTTQELPVGNQTKINVSLAEDAEQLEEVVVTAFGMERDKKALGYSVQEVKGSSLALAKEPNIINSLSGKVAGVQITKTAGGAGGSSRVVIRGNSSLSGSNQPLYIVDGVPIDNSSYYSAAGYWDGGIDYGDGIGDLNPDDIESMSVLKGAAASALYGSRAAGGVILITTKTGGEAERGIGVEYNGNVTFETPLVLPSFQNKYGVGINGAIPDAADIRNRDLGAQSSWGAEMNGQSFTDWTGETRSYSPQSGNVEDFFELGHTITNSLAITGGNDIADFRVSYTNLQNKGITPTSEFERNSIGLRGRVRATDKLSFDTKVNYFNVKGHNRAYMAETMENPMFSFINMPRSVRLQDLQNNITRDGEAYNFTENHFVLNPYFSLNEAPNWDEKNRILGFASAKYEFTDWLSFQARTSLDFWTHDRYQTAAQGIVNPDGTQSVYDIDGKLQKDAYKVMENNTDFLLTAKKDITIDLTSQIVLGANFLTQQVTHTQMKANSLLQRDWYSFNNSNGGIEAFENYTEKQVNSVFAAANFAYKNMLFVDATYRMDWSSSIPDQSFDYPSITGAFAFSELFDVDPSIFTFGKVRASYAQVGNDTDPYRTSVASSVITVDVLGAPAGAIGNYNNRGDDLGVSVVDPNLIPEKTSSYEFGLDLKFFDNRLGLDVTYYDAVTENQILPVSLPESSGVHSIVINDGKVRNSGIEVLLTATPIKSISGFQWDLGLNYTRNRNEILELSERNNLDELLLNQSARGEALIYANVGSPYGEILGNDFVRDANGLPILDENGGFQVASNTVLGNITPDYLLGLSNTFTYKNFRLNAVIDASIGGETFSYTNYALHMAGAHENTVAQREEGMMVTDAEGNAVTMDAEVYYRELGKKNIATDFVEDASYVKLRELSFGYLFPSSFTERTPFSELSLSFVGRNLFFIYNGMDGIDPESLVSRNMLGIEYAAMPSTSSYGFNLNVKF